LNLREGEGEEEEETCRGPIKGSLGREKKTERRTLIKKSKKTKKRRKKRKKKEKKKKKKEKRKKDVQRVFQLLQHKEERFHVATEEEIAAALGTTRGLKIGQTLRQQPQY